MSGNDKKLILVDLDGVMVDAHGLAYRLGYLQHPACRWDMEGCCLQDGWTHDDLFTNTGLFEVLNVPYATAGVVRLMSVFRIQFVSTPWPSNPDSARAKYRWVDRWFRSSMLTLTHDKTLIPATALIDDKPGLVGPWEHVVYPQAWNDGAERGVPTWSDGLAEWMIERFA